MLYKRSNYELIEKVRADERVREAFHVYRCFTEDNELWVSIWWLVYRKKERALRSEAFNGPIRTIAKVYQELTGRSPTTVDSATYRSPFADFVREVFKAEGLKPPAINAVRQTVSHGTFKVDFHR